MIDTKRCSKCSRYKRLHLFRRHISQKDGLSTRCKLCEKRYQRAYKALNRRKVRDRWLRYSKGITISEYDRLFKKQHGSCAICKAQTVGSLHVDHDHKTGQIRGLLCRNCNRGIGFLGDSAEIVCRACNYLRKAGRCHEKKSACNE